MIGQFFKNIVIQTLETRWQQTCMGKFCANFLGTWNFCGHKPCGHGRGELQNLYITTQALLSKKFQKCPKVIHMYYGWPLKNTRYTIIHTVYNLPETMRWKHGFWALKWLSLLLKLSHQPLCQKSHIDLLKRMKQPCLWNLSYS